MVVLTAAEPERHASIPARRRWRLSWLTAVVVVIALAGLGVLLYPSVAAWFSQYNQSLLIEDYVHDLSEVKPPGNDVSLGLAHQYNDALSSGANLASGANVATGSGGQPEGIEPYNMLLRATEEGVIARLRVPTADVDLPIYHGTSDETLMRGVGHLEGTSLPVGGENTHSVLTAHRGLANATMFTNLDAVKVGDTFTIEVFGEVLTYQVRQTQVVDPNDTRTLFPQQGEDLVTLVTCTPLGINSHRILVTGERVTPTPIKDVEAAGEPSQLPGFPWWAAGFAAGLLIIALYIWWAGYPPRRRKPRPSAATREGAR